MKLYSKLPLFLFVLFCFLLTVPTYGQKRRKGGTQMYVPKKSKSDHFGSRSAPKKIMKNKTDKVRPFGFQAQLGTTTTLVHPNSKNEKGGLEPKGQYEINPITQAGFMAELGFVHMNVRSAGIRKRIIDYVDYGVGYKMWQGAEAVSIEKNLIRERYRNTFKYHDIFARVGVHKLQYLTTKKNLFIDHSLGVNFDYRLASKASDNASPLAQFEQKPDGNMHLNVHYDVGLGIRLAKGKYLVIGVQAPLVEFLNKPIGNPTFTTFSSKYYPFMIRLKYIHLFPARKSNQACWLGDEEQRKLNDQFLQGQ